MNKFSRVFFVVFAAILSFSCKSQFEAMLISNDVDLKYEAAFQYFNAGKFSKAASLFESLSMLTSGTERDDTVQYYWGLSNYRFKDYMTAEVNFDKFVGSFPNSPFTSEARFLRLDCLYRSTYRYELDQSPTYRAMDEIANFIKEYPRSGHLSTCEQMLNDLQGRLDRKAYEAARLYYNMEDYLASRVAFKNILKENSENIYREDILYYTAMSSYKYAHLSVAKKQKERYLTFIDDYLNFVGELPDSDYKKELDTLYKRAQKALGRTPVEDDNMQKDEKDFMKERKKLERSRKKSESASKKNDKKA